METKEFPRVKNVIKKRTKSGQRYLLHGKDPCGNDVYVTIPIVDTDTEKDYFKKIQEARIKLSSKKNGSTFEKLLSEYIEKRQLAESSTTGIKNYLKGFTLNNEVNIKRVKELVTNDKYKPSTIKTRLACIRSFYRWIILSGRVEGIVDPTIDFSIKHVISRRSRVLTEEEEKKLLKSLPMIKYPELQLIIRLALYTGARVSSICALSLNSIRDGKVYYYNVKTKKEYDYPIPLKDEETINLFNRLSKRGYLFTKTCSNCTCLIDYYLGRIFPKDSRGESISIHSLRHTFATKAIQNGVPPEIVARLLDHSSPDITLRIYGKHSQQQLEDAILKMSSKKE